MTETVDPRDRRLLRRQMLADDVYEAIKTMLMDHVVRPGARISIDGLAREFQVSSTPVREALARLESEGLADKEPLKGYRATPLLSLDEFEDLYRFRLLLEPWAARRAAELIDDEGRELLTAELSTAVEPTSVDYAGYKSLTAHDNRFHSLIAGLSGSEQVRLAFQRTHCHLHIFRLHFDRDIGPEVLVEHRQIVEAITSGDPVAAEAAMTQHIENSMSVRLRRIYD
ncbi:DNA-binding GntR family transcriptional regulator [Kribbella orskensis]|uniref:DNA-binding GntR family transcriptional regulator n=1 Tax=Kribbella orskensis TaxID=2512216 RepID=A0ABY2BF54_9ACTN|nr:MULTISPECIES: GntR family transcriptional regulator [Kribbella]TCN36883.1 DNA-binding GntR family transcriptional regulator [Kribbella sp. VKM Ac-2500]TCO18307.1 DNA-binding GntR family transcriptional regulator [Kribbella orskensis]